MTPSPVYLVGGSRLFRQGLKVYLQGTPFEAVREIARELARTVLPVSLYTQWIWKIDLHNLMHFLDLRLDPHAQIEIRLFAEAMAAFVRAWVPMAWEAFVDYRREAVPLSRLEALALGRMLAGADESVRAGAIAAAGLKGRELQEFEVKLARMRALAADSGE